MNRIINIVLLCSILVVTVCCRQRDRQSGLPANQSYRASGDTVNLATPITYDVIIHNPDTADTWTTECLAGMDQQALTDFIFSAIYSKKLTAYDFYSGKPLPLRKIRKLEEEMGKDRSRLGKIQFTENWYLDTVLLTMDKKVSSMMFGYEVYDDQGNVRGYKAAFRINLNQP